ncbi:DUF4012 domain-containing protein [Isoptericola haloaureus]|uniref:DUF4012 domain-containing protein n=1 Tax=Isoptericola haloaureus TaxID=1542902 RepID=A0ABU7Z5C7_9MICO
MARPTDAETSRATPPAPRRRRPVRWVLLGIAALVAVVVACTALLARDALTARDALEEAALIVPEVEQSLRAGLTDVADDDGGSLTDTPALAELQEQTGTAREATDGPLWRVAALLPVVGASVDAATTVSAVLDQVAEVALPALATAGDAVARTGRDDDGSIDLQPLAASAEDVGTARAVIADAHAELAGIDTTALQSQFVGPVTLLEDQLARLDELLGGAERAAALLPPMLGADEPRRYLLLGLNNAELRAGGGIVGSLTLLEADGGRVDVVRQASSGDVGPFAEPVVPLDPEVEAAYTTRVGRFVQDVTLTPDFPTSARIAAAMWEQDHGPVDGVLATDPVALSRLLEVTGPVTVEVPADIADAIGTERVEITAETVVDLLLRRAYDALDGEGADDFFAIVASTVFARLSTTDVSPVDALPALQHAAQSHRLLVWSAREDEQALIDGTLLSGGFSADRAADATGMFLDDTVLGKLSSHLETTVEHTGSVCTDEGRTDTVTLRLANTLDEERARDLPFYVAGPVGAPDRGTMSLNLTAYGARDGDVPELTRDDDVVGGSSLVVQGRPRVAVNVRLAPGESTEVTMTTRAPAAVARGGGAPAPGTRELWTTPTVGTPGLHVAEVPVCG